MHEILGVSLSVAPLFFARNAIVVTVHFDAWAIGQKELRLVAGTHLSAVFATVAAIWRAGQGWLLVRGYRRTCFCG
jgi:signal transduction histidine kinase